MKTRIAALGLLAVLALTGCAESVGNVASDTLRTPSAESPEPLVAAVSEAPAVGTDAAYVAQLREALEGSGGNSIPDASDEQLVRAGREACEQMTAGTALEDVRVIQDEPDTGVGYKDSLRIAAVAAVHFCAEFNPGG